MHPFFSPSFLFLPPLSRRPLFFASVGSSIVSRHWKWNREEKERKEKRRGESARLWYGSHRWFRMNLSERHPCLSSLWSSGDQGLGVALYRAVEIEKRSTLEPGYFHDWDGHNIDAAEISCGSRPLPISTTTIIESGVYRRKSSIPSFRLYYPLYLSYFDRSRIFYRFIARDFAPIVNEN